MFNNIGKIAKKENVEISICITPNENLYLTISDGKDEKSSVIGSDWYKEDILYIIKDTIWRFKRNNTFGGDR